MKRKHSNASAKQLSWKDYLFGKKLSMMSVGIAILAVTVGLYSYTLTVIPTAVLTDLADNKKQSKDRTFGGKPTQPELSVSAEDEEEFTVFEEVLKKKIIGSPKEGWIRVLNETIPSFQLSSTSNSELYNLSRYHFPFYLTNKAILDKWPLFEWDLHKLAGHTNISLEGCRYQPIPLFILGEDRDKGGMLGSSHDFPLLYTNLTLKQFIQSTFNDQVYLYWTGELEYFEGAFRQNGTVDHHFAGSNSNKKKSKKQKKVDNSLEKQPKKSTGWEYFIIKEKNLKISSSNSTLQDDDDEEEYDLDFWTPMLWLSHPGIVSQSHYDTQHNLFIQLQGVKRFYLFPPAVTGSLHSFPNIHRSYRQSQIPFSSNISSDDFMLFPQAFNKESSNNSLLSAYEIILKPGDILYIPPYWSHLIESLSLSLSLSILSPSMIEAALSEIYWQKVPFGEFGKSKYHRMLIIKIYFERIFEVLSPVLGIFGNSTTKSLSDFVSDLYASRYHPLEKSLFSSYPPNLDPISFCFDKQSSPSNDNDETEFEEKVNDFNLLLTNHSERIDFTVMRISILIKQLLETQQQQINNLENSGNFKKLENIKKNDFFSSYSHSAIKIFLMDYIEQLSRWAVGPQYTPYFLKHCYSLNSFRSVRTPAE
jgi:hypothetical protein